MQIITTCPECVYDNLFKFLFVSNGMGSQIQKTDVVIDDVILTTSVVMVKNA